MESNMKRWVILALALCFTAALLYGCGKKKEAVSGPSSSVAPVSAATASPTPAPQTAKAVQIDAEPGLNIRSAPSTDGEILGLAEDDSMLPLLVEKAEDGWYQVEYQGKTAYVSAEFAAVKEVTLEEYNRLRAGSVSSHSPESSLSSSAPEKDPESSPAPSPSAPESSPNPGDDEDGE